MSNKLMQKTYLEAKQKAIFFFFRSENLFFRFETKTGKQDYLKKHIWQ
jgi:hypothetical protein